MPMPRDNITSIKGIDGNQVFVHTWLPEKVTAALIISHGMMEHGGRYSSFAGFLAERGIAVFAPDQRGHGISAEVSGKLGYFGDNVSHEQLVNDLFCLHRNITSQYPGTPIFLLGQSMGSLISRSFIIKYGEEIEGVMLLGTFQEPRLLIKTGVILAWIIKKLRGGRYHSKLVQGLSLNRYNRPFKPNTTPFDWLSSDEKAVDDYVQDPLSGKGFMVGSFFEMFRLYLSLRKGEDKGKMPANLPVLILSGGKDPVGMMGRYPENLFSRYKKAGQKDVVLKIYPGLRHDMINEVNRKEIYGFIYNWLKERL